MVWYNTLLTQHFAFFSYSTHNHQYCTTYRHINNTQDIGHLKFDGLHRIRNFAIKHSRCFGGGVVRFWKALFSTPCRTFTLRHFSFWLISFVLLESYQQSLSFACSILRYLRKTLHKLSTIFVEHVHVARIQLPTLYSCAWYSGPSYDHNKINGCSHLNN